MNPERLKKITRLANNRQQGVTIILENISDPHNMGAVVRTCDAIGIAEIYMIYSDPSFIPEEVAVGKITGAGARKWVDVHYYENLEFGIRDIRKKYDKIYATHLGSKAISLYEIDLTQNIALMFGNEKQGITKEALSLVDGNFIIPQMGMVQSLNISVACAVSMYEVLRQRSNVGMYNHDYEAMKIYRQNLCNEYKARSDDGHIGRDVIKHLDEHIS